MKCKHHFHFVRIYFKSKFKLLDLAETKYASFVCDKCGLLKELEVKNE
jgi:hypothetical protein